MAPEAEIPSANVVAFRRAVGDVWRQLGEKGYKFNIYKFNPKDGVAQFAVNGTEWGVVGTVVIMMDLCRDLQITFSSGDDGAIRNEIHRIFLEAGFTDSKEDHIKEMCLLLDYPKPAAA